MNAIKSSTSGLAAWALCLLLWAGASSGALAGKSEPNPFQGTWCGALNVSDYLNLTISKSGRVEGSWGNVFGVGTVSGKISSSGVMNVTLKMTGERGRFGAFQTHATALVTIDADGSLVALWHWEGANDAYAIVLIAC